MSGLGSKSTSPARTTATFISGANEPCACTLRLESVRQPDDSRARLRLLDPCAHHAYVKCEVERNYGDALLAFRVFMHVDYIFFSLNLTGNVKFIQIYFVY